MPLQLHQYGTLILRCRWKCLHREIKYRRIWENYLLFWSTRPGFIRSNTLLIARGLCNCVGHHGSKNPPWLHRLVDVGDWVRWYTKDTGGYCNCYSNLREYSPPRLFYFFFAFLYLYRLQKSLYYMFALETFNQCPSPQQEALCVSSSHVRRQKTFQNFKDEDGSRLSVM